MINKQGEMLFPGMVVVKWVKKQPSDFYTQVNLTPTFQFRWWGREQGKYKGLMKWINEKLQTDLTYLPLISNESPTLLSIIGGHQGLEEGDETSFDAHTLVGTVEQVEKIISRGECEGDSPFFESSWISPNPTLKFRYEFNQDTTPKKDDAVQCAYYKNVGLRMLYELRCALILQSPLPRTPEEQTVFEDVKEAFMTPIFQKMGATYTRIE